jgi:hypothetical protein
MGVLHPRLLPLHLLLNTGGLPPQGIPQQLVLSSEVLDIGGVHLIENGTDLLLHFDRDAPDALTQVRAGLPRPPAWRSGRLRVCWRGGG